MKTATNEQLKIKNAVDKAIEEIMGHNFDFSEQSKELFEKIKDSQSPVMTLVYCSDSRVQVTSIVKQPINYACNDYEEALVAQANVDYQVQEALAYFGDNVND